MFTQDQNNSLFERIDRLLVEITNATMEQTKLLSQLALSVKMIALNKDLIDELNSQPVTPTERSEP